MVNTTYSSVRRFRKPNQLIYDATGEELNPSYLIDYMKAIYFDVYQVQ